MKKILLILLLTTNYCYAEPATYLKLGGGLIKRDNSKISEGKMRGHSKNSEHKPLLEAGVGYDAGVFRFDILYNYTLLNFLENMECVFFKYDVKHKIKTHNYSANFYKDLYAYRNFSLFAGAGGGVVRIENKHYGKATVIKNQRIAELEKGKFVQHSIFLKGLLGIEYEIAENINLYLTYTKYRLKQNYESSAGFHHPKYLNDHVNVGFRVKL